MRGVRFGCASIASVLVFLGLPLAASAAVATGTATTTATASPVNEAATTVAAVFGLFSSPAIVALVSGLVAGGFTLAATRRNTEASRELERHKFRYEIGRMAAEQRLNAYIELASLVSAAYRKKTTGAGPAATALDALHEAKNFYFDNRFYFSPGLGSAFRAATTSLGVDHPNKPVLEDNMNSFFHVVRDDLLLNDLQSSAHRAIKAAAAPDLGKVS